MPSSTNASSAAVIWQGFQHRWGYNHRINRLGSYVEHTALSGSSCQADVVHTAASGTGPDSAACTEFFTTVQADDVWFQTGSVQIKIKTQEEALGLIEELVPVDLAPELAGKENYEVFLNGFDLIADGDADKLNSFALSVGKIALDEERTALSVLIAGFLIVDCDTIECDWGVIAGSADDLDKAVLAMENTAESRAIEPAQDLTAYSDVTPLFADLERNLTGLPSTSVSYTLKVHFVVVAGNAGDLHITESQLFENRFEWDGKNELSEESEGTLSVTIPGSDIGQNSASTLAFKHFFTALEREQSWFKPDKALHLLQWNIAIQKITAGAGAVTAELGLFFKNWRRGMIFARPLWSLGALRHAGSARIGARLVLLQFKGAAVDHTYAAQKIEWPGKNRKATDPAAESKTPVRV